MRSARNFDSVLEREPIRKLLLAVTSPNDAVDCNPLRKFQLNPPFAPFVGDPTATVSVFAVVEVFEPMDVRIRVNTRCPPFGAAAVERNVPRRLLCREHFQLVEAWLRVSRPGDGEPKFGRDG